jgi:hypothetical protein
MPVILGVAVGGASARYALDRVIEARSESIFPWGGAEGRRLEPRRPRSRRGSPDTDLRAHRLSRAPRRPDPQLRGRLDGNPARNRLLPSQLPWREDRRIVRSPRDLHLKPASLSTKRSGASSTRRNSSISGCSRLRASLASSGTKSQLRFGYGQDAALKVRPSSPTATTPESTASSPSALSRVRWCGAWLQPGRSDHRPRHHARDPQVT